MVRTRADNTGKKVVGAKAPRKQLGGGFSNNSPVSKDKQGGGNPVRWTPTPSWQKGIGNFFQKRDGSTGEKSSESKREPASSTESTSEQEPLSEE